MISLAELRTFWEVTLAEVVLDFPDETPSFWLRRAEELFLRRLGLLLEECGMRPPLCLGAASRRFLERSADV